MADICQLDKLSGKKSECGVMNEVSREQQILVTIPATVTVIVAAKNNLNVLYDVMYCIAM